VLERGGPLFARIYNEALCENTHHSTRPVHQPLPPHLFPPTRRHERCPRCSHHRPLGDGVASGRYSRNEDLWARLGDGGPYTFINGVSAYPYVLLPSAAASELTSSTASPTAVPHGRSFASFFGCPDDGSECPYIADDYDDDGAASAARQGIVDYSFMLCADPESPYCYAPTATRGSSTLQVVPPSFALTATPVVATGGSVSVPDFSSWRSMMESSLSESIAEVKSMLSAAKAAATAAPAHGEDGEDDHHEEQEDGADEDDLVQEAAVHETDGVDDEIEKEETSDSAMAPYLEAAYALPGDSSSSSTPDSDLTPPVNPSCRGVAPVPNPDAMASPPALDSDDSTGSDYTIPSLENSTPPPSTLGSDDTTGRDDVSPSNGALSPTERSTHKHMDDEEFEEIMGGKFGDDWLAAFDVPVEQPSAAVLSACSATPMASPSSPVQ
jgi:hypothetical protein